MDALDDAQFEEFGVVVAGAGINATHLANGVVLTLLSLPELCRPGTSTAQRSEPSARKRTQGAIRAALATLGLEGDLLSQEARAICVFKTKDGPTWLGEGTTPPQKYLKMVEAGRRAIRDRLGPSCERFGEPEHELLSRALNADGKVLASGASSPTTPGVALVGFDPNYTLYTMIPSTFVALLAQTELGRGCLRTLVDLAWDMSDALSRLAQDLGVSSGGRRLEEVTLIGAGEALPIPSFAPGDEARSRDWSQLAQRLGELTSRLLSWSSQGTDDEDEPFSSDKFDLLMSLVDLIGLVFFLRGLGPRPGRQRPLLLVGAEAPREADRVAVKLAKDSFKRASRDLERLVEARSKGAEEDLALDPAHRKKGKGDKRVVHTREGPLTPFFKNIAQSTRWLYPRGGASGRSRGAAQYFLCPGVRQLSTLTRALVGRDEQLKWSDFHARARELGVLVGGAEEQSAAQDLGILGARAGLQLAGRANQRVLIELGLAYRESDNVVIVTGGA